MVVFGRVKTTKKRRGIEPHSQGADVPTYFAGEPDGCDPSVLRTVTENVRTHEIPESLFESELQLVQIPVLPPLLNGSGVTHGFTRDRKFP